MLKAEGKSWTLSPADLGSVLDVTKQDGKIDVSLNRDLLDGRLTNVYNDLMVKPVEASYDFDSDGDIFVKPSHEGRSVEGEKLLDSAYRVASSKASASTRCPLRWPNRVHHDRARGQEADRAAGHLQDQLHGDHRPGPDTGGEPQDRF